jgi:hypothetical protein
LAISDWRFPISDRQSAIKNRQSGQSAIRNSQFAIHAEPGQVLTARLTVPDATGLHAVRLRVTMPAGVPADWLDQVILVGPEGAAIPLPIAFNDPKGTWTVQAIDLYTERATEARLTVE